MDINWSIRIKKLRKKLIITQQELAEMLGVSFATINRYENNIHEPTTKTKRELNKLFKKHGVIK